MSYPLTFAATLLLITVLVILLFAAGQFGNGRALKTRERLRAATPKFKPKARDWVDERGRPW